MNALYDFFLTPQPEDSTKKRYHARLVVRDTVTLEDIADTIESRCAVRSPKEMRAESVRCGGVVFTPEKDLLRQLKATTFEKVSETRRSQELSDIEIDGKLAEHFKDHATITTLQLASLCGLSKATALRRLQKRVQAGKLTHPGYLQAPHYFPVPGWFGVSKNR